MILNLTGHEAFLQVVTEFIMGTPYEKTYVHFHLKIWICVPRKAHSNVIFPQLQDLRLKNL